MKLSFSPLIFCCLSKSTLFYFVVRSSSRGLPLHVFVCVESQIKNKCKYIVKCKICNNNCQIHC
jgi:Na+/serine symporter